MTHRKSAQINLSQVLMQVSLKTFAASGTATGFPLLAGLTMLSDALAASDALRAVQEKREPVQLDLPAPACWTRSAEAWQQGCSHIEQQLPAILEHAATALKAVRVFIGANVQSLLLQSVAGSMPTWEVPAQERGLVATYVALQLFTKVADELASVLAPLRSDALLDMTANILSLLKRAREAIPAQTTLSVAATLQQKMQAEAYDVYLCYHEADEQEALAIGEALKGHGLLPWCDWLAWPGTLRRKEQEHFITTLPAAAILVGHRGSSSGRKCKCMH